ncbi:MAG TPA: DNA primase [Firmicutes bacterium]|nr:DNA primase [Bacillota bacterium]
MVGKVPNEVFDDIRSSVDIVDVIGEQVSLKKAGRNYKGPCPFHQEKTPSFSVSSDKQVYHCFGCGASGNVVTFLMESQGYTFYEAMLDLAKRSGKEHLLKSVSFPSVQREESNDKDLYDVHDILTKLYMHYLLNSDEGTVARKYLEKRNVFTESIKLFQIGYAPGKDLALNYLKSLGYELELLDKAGIVTKSESGIYRDTFRDRLIFPIHDALGRVIAFSGRTLNDRSPKYLNSKETPLFHKTKILYNFHRARQEIKQTGTVVLFEGYMDCIAAHAAGVSNGIATMGTSFTQEHLSVIGKNIKEIKLCFDGDAAGLKATSITGRFLVENGYQVSVCRLPSGLDPDEYIRKYGKEEFQNQIIFGTKTYISFQLEYVKKDKNLDRAEDFGQYLKEALEIIAQVKNEFVQEGYIQALSMDIGISSRDLKEKLDRLQKGGLNTSPPGQSLATEKAFVPKRGLTQFTVIQNAERFLLAYMLESSEITMRVKERIYQSFSIVEHQAIATLLYAFYEEGSPPSLEKFLGQVSDACLRAIILDISEIPIPDEISQQAFEDYCRIILVDLPEMIRKEKIEKEIEEAERNHNYIRAAELVQELAKKNAGVLIPMKN